MRTLILTSLAAAGAQSARCYPHHGTECRFDCDDGNMYDLSLLVAEAAADGGYLHAEDPNAHTYYFVGCSAAKLPVTCEASDPSSGPPIAIQSWGGSPPTLPSGSCASLGAVETERCSTEKRGADTNLACRYSSGDGGRAVAFHFECDPGAAVPIVRRITQAGTGGQLLYSIFIAGASLCARWRPPPPSPPKPPPYSCEPWCSEWTCEFAACRGCGHVCHSPPSPPPPPRPYPPRTPAWVFRPPPSPPPPPPGPPGSGTCVNTCRYASDGDCDDGGPGSDYSECTPCTDCADCGPRAHCDFNVSPPPPHPPCAQYLSAPSRYPFCDPPSARGHWAVDLERDFGPRCDSNMCVLHASKHTICSCLCTVPAGCCCPHSCEAPRLSSHTPLSCCLAVPLC